MEKSAVVISFINLKGGVGKTSSAINIADELSNKGNVLVIDMDPQFNATQALLNYQLANFKKLIPKTILDSVENDLKTSYGAEESDRTEEAETESSKIKFDIKSQLVYQKLKELKLTANTLFKKDSLVDEIKSPDLIYNIKENLSLLAGDLDLFESLNGDTVGKHNVLEDHFNKYNLRNIYDYIIIDCPPNWTILTQASLFASDYYIIPSKVDLFSSIGIGLLQKLVKSTFYDEKSSNIYSMYKMFRKNAQRDVVKPLGVLFTLTHDIVISETIKSKLRREIKELTFFNTEIPYHQSVSLKFSLYSESGDKYKSLKNSLEKVVTEIEDFIQKNVSTNVGGEING
ncbi:ParA family protein [Enterococcus sp. DIV0996a]|uniref:ParA family protein n=1 Tax=Enterococcus sp. DIV0996a TaxID=2774790 RepID=UPI003F26D5CB